MFLRMDRFACFQFGNIYFLWFPSVCFLDISCDWVIDLTSVIPKAPHYCGVMTPGSLCVHVKSTSFPKCSLVLSAGSPVDASVENPTLCPSCPVTSQATLGREELHSDSCPAQNPCFAKQTCLLNTLQNFLSSHCNNRIFLESFSITFEADLILLMPKSKDAIERQSNKEFSKFKNIIDIQNQATLFVHPDKIYEEKTGVHDVCVCGIGV